MVRCKFQCNLKDPGEKGSVKLIPVYSGSEENKKFFDCTPSGKIQLGILNPEAFKQFELGKEYYIDITPANGYTMLNIIDKYKEQLAILEEAQQSALNNKDCSAVRELSTDICQLCNAVYIKKATS